MHPKTKKLFYPNNVIDAESIGLNDIEDTEIERWAKDIIIDETLERLDAGELAEHCVQVDLIFHDRLKSHEGERGYSDNEGVTDYEHEETVWNFCNEWVLGNVDVVGLSEYVDMSEETLTNVLTNKVYDKVDPIDEELWPGPMKD